MKTPKERYNQDNEFHALVNLMLGQIEQCHFTPSEMREAAVLASILYEERLIRAYDTKGLEIPKSVIRALELQYKWLTSIWNPKTSNKVETN